MSQQSTSTVIKETLHVDVPRMYDVYILNDDFTPMDFVVHLLVEVFGKSTADAFQIMMSVHNSDRGKVGTYSYDMARSKVNKATRLARSEGHPLRLTFEPQN